MPAMPHRRRTALLLAGLLPALAGLAPAPVRANDRDPRATPVPAAACVEFERSANLAANPWMPGSGYFGVAGEGVYVWLRCPLPLNQVDLSGTTNDNDLSKIRVHYRDADGFGQGGLVSVTLERTTTAGATMKVCEWGSNQDGTGATTPARSTKACPHDLADGAFYVLNVQLRSASIGAFVHFLGVDFPQ